MLKEFRIKEIIGCWLHERWRTEKVLATWLPTKLRGSWLELCNRNENILPGSDDSAKICSWENSSYLTVAKVFPRVGGQLFVHCARLFPFRLGGGKNSQRTSSVRLSVVIPFGGEERLKQMACVLESFYAQDTDEFEIILTGKEISKVIRSTNHIRYTRLVECDTENGKFNKSFFLNRGVDASLAPYILLHDADIVVPANYVRMILSKLDQGWDAVHPIRFLFYFGRMDTKLYLSSKGVIFPKKIKKIRANFHGGSTALSREAYYRIGGMNEELGDRGFHDVEFNQRNMKNNIFKGRFAPSIHLWHPANRNIDDNPIIELFKQISEIPVNERIKLLRVNYSKSGINVGCTKKRGKAK